MVGKSAIQAASGKKRSKRSKACFWILSKLLKRWSGRRGSNPRRPAWEVTRHFNFRHLESAGVGLESTETPGKTAVHRERLLMECNWSAARAIQEPVESALR